MAGPYHSLGDEFLRALTDLRAHSIALLDDAGDVLWLSEGAIGPDEHGAVRAAFEGFADQRATGIATEDLGDSRLAIVVRAENLARVTAGAVLIIVDARSVTNGGPLEARVLTPQVRGLLQQFAIELQPPLTLDIDEASPPLTLDIDQAPPPPVALAVEPAVVIPTLRPAPGAPGQYASPPKVAARDASPTLDRAVAALRSAVINLHAQPLAPARPGTRIRRFEVLLRSPASKDANSAPQQMLARAARDGLGSTIDRRVLTDLLGWLVRHRHVWDVQPVMFSVNLSATTLLDERFGKFVELCMTKATLPRGTIAFELADAGCREHSAGFAKLAATLRALGCPLIIDDFGWHQQSVELLRARGVRMVKLDSQMTDGLENDKVRQAQVAGIVQMARVLGMHTVAKRVQSAACKSLLVALGIDFMQSFALGPPVDLDSLAARLAAEAAADESSTSAAQQGA